MATKTVGTDATTTLTGVTFSKSLSAADMASIQNGIKNDAINGRPVYPGAFASNGLLYIPNRGILEVKPGDVIAFDTQSGWPILLSAISLSVANSSWNISA